MIRYGAVLLAGLLCAACATAPHRTGEGGTAAGVMGRRAPVVAEAPPPPPPMPWTQLQLPAPTVPSEPTGFSAVATGATYTVKGTFTDNASTEDGFTVERGATGSPADCVANPASTACTSAVAAACGALNSFAQVQRLGANTAPAPSPVNFTDVVDAGACYCYRVKATAGSVSSAYSNVAGIYVATAPPPPLPAPVLQSVK